jgi:hypothetical protein
MAKDFMNLISLNKLKNIEEVIAYIHEIKIPKQWEARG